MRAAVGYAVTAVFAVLLVSLGTGVLHDHAPTLESKLRRQLNGAPRSEFRATLVRFVRAHPSHPIYAVLAAAEALRHHDRNAGRWINRGLQLAPGWGAPHAQAAQWLWNGGHRKQALLELALAAKADPYGTRDLACAVAKVDPEGVIGVAARTADRGLFLELVSTGLPEDSSAAERLDAEIMRVAPEWPQAFARQAARLIRRDQLEPALELAHRATVASRTMAPEDVSGIIVETKALIALGRLEDAERTIRTGVGAHPDAMSLRTLQVDLATKRGDRAGLSKAIIAMRGLARNAAVLADVYRLEASSERKLGNLATALRAYEEAYQIASDRDSLRAVAELAEALGDRRRAMRARAELCNLDPKDGSCARAPGSR